MKKKFVLQRGQAIVLLALGMVGLIGLTALAIDGGRAFADRRHAQNAADNAAYAASFEWLGDNGHWIDETTWSNTLWEQAGLAIANENGYLQSNLPTSDVRLSIERYYFCEAKNPTVPPLGARITVEIYSRLDTLFAPVIGTMFTENTVRATAIACKEYPGNAGAGNTAVACNKTACDAFVFSGNSDSYIKAGTDENGNMIGGGAFVNSNCCTATGLKQALTADGTAGQVIVDNGIDVVGCEAWRKPSQDPSLWPTIRTGAQQIDCFEDIIRLEDIRGYAATFLCKNDNGTDAISPTNNGPKTDGFGNKYLEPGQYTGKHFPPGPAGEVFLWPGIYCIKGDWVQNSSTWMLGHYDVGFNYSDNKSDPSFVNGVTFVVDGDVLINGGGVKLRGMYFGDPLNGRLLIYAPFRSNTGATIPHTITINGDIESQFTGTMFAPTSTITLAGTGNTNPEVDTWVGQVFGDTIKVTGTFVWRLIYNEDAVIDFLYRPTISMER